MKILETIKQNYLLPNDETVVLLHNLYDGEDDFITLTKWCNKQNWKFVQYKEIIGNEASVVILYDYGSTETELFSRAKNCLIIVHK